MKAQLSIDFIVSLIIFIGFVAYIFFQLISYSPPYINEIADQRLKSETYQVSELLINSPVGFGLSDITKNKTNLLSLNKIKNFGCQSPSDYDAMKSSIDTDYQFSIVLTNSTGWTLINCTTSQPVAKATKSEVRRIVAFDNLDYGELVVQMW